MHTFTCRLCPAVYAISNALLDESQAVFFCQLAGWKYFQHEQGTDDTFWCPRCRRKHEPPLPPPPPKPSRMAKLRETRRKI